MRKCVLFALLAVALCSSKACAQGTNLEYQQCANKIKVLMDHFAKIANKNEDDNIKDYHIEVCLDLFMSGGNDTKDNDGNVIFPAPRIEVSSLATGKKNSYLIKPYLKRLKSLPSNFAFKAATCYVLEKINKEIGNGKYEATVSKYILYLKDNGVSSFDREPKTIRVILDDNSDLMKSRVLLGDVKLDLVAITD